LNYAGLQAGDFVEEFRLSHASGHFQTCKENEVVAQV
jgi:hypothetical protein